ncbi:putative pentatricopeptide repeat-containing protein [Helianthus debilis subsp. tardiflorus]
MWTGTLILFLLKIAKKEHHLWNKRDSAASGQKALILFELYVCGLPNEKEAIYRALDKWTAWETEFPVIAVAKALNILKQRKQWKRVIQVAKWMFGKGQGMTMGTFDTLLLAFDMDQRVFADMEELGVKPDEDTTRKVARAFKNVGETEKQQLVLNKYLSEWKYIHFNGERVRVRRKYSWNDD